MGEGERRERERARAERAVAQACKRDGESCCTPLLTRHTHDHAADCNAIEKESFCGCRPGGEGLCGPYFDASGNPVLFDTDLPGYPRQYEGAPTNTASQKEVERFGSPCTYVGKSTKKVPTDLCLPAAYVKTGTQAEAVLAPLTVSGIGSPSIKFYGALDDVNRALGGLSYKTRPYYNRLYRPPVAERGPGFDPTFDSVDLLTVIADDLGNSGGMQRDIQTTKKIFTVRTRAVNNAPYMTAPERITAHEDLVMKVALDQQHDRTLIVTAGWHSVATTGWAHIYVWDLRSGSPIKNWQAHEDVINQVVLTADDSIIVSCSGTYEPKEGVKVDYSVRVFEASSGLQLLKLPRPSQLLNQGHILGTKCVAVNDDGTMIISGGYDRAVCLWDIHTGKMLNRIGGLVDVPTINSTMRVPSRIGHTKTVTGVGFFNMPDQDDIQLARAISVSDDMSIRLYDLTTSFGQELQCIGPASANCKVASTIGHKAPITAMAIMNTAVHKVLATASEDASVILWILGSVELSKWQTLDPACEDDVLSVSMMSSIALLGRVPRPIIVLACGRRSEYPRIKFMQTQDTAVKTLDLETLQKYGEVQTNIAHLAGMPVTMVALTADGKRLVTSNEDGKVVVLDINTFEIVSQFPCPCICAASLFPDPWSRCKEAPCNPGCEPSTVQPLRVVSSFALFNNPAMISDPDSMDYGFDSKIFRFEASCTHGKLHITESYLKPERRCSNDGSLCKGNRDCLSPDGNNGLCQNQAPRISTYERQKGATGVPCGPTPESAVLAGCKLWPPRQGIHMRPDMRTGEGNKELAIQGTMGYINKALAGLSYVADPFFNTRFGLVEKIQFLVNDGGSIADNYAVSSVESRLEGSGEIIVLVESVNNPPKIGSLRSIPTPVINPESGLIVVINMDSLAPIDDSKSPRCMTLSAASSEYNSTCRRATRAHIDVDEDTIFTITPDLLWVNDVDSKESIDMIPLRVRTYACDDVSNLEGCNCGQACLCGRGMCKCGEPSACDNELFTPGELLVEMRVGKGKLSISPPPGRNMVPVKFLQNVTDMYPSVHECLLKLNPEVPLGAQLGLCYKKCPNQLACAINSSFLVFQTTTATLQTILRQKYLTYVGNENTYGQDSLQVWVTDQGFTDEWYNLKKSYLDAAEKTLKIRIVGVNDAPVVEIPDYVINYQIETPCGFDWMRAENKKGSVCPLDGSVLDQGSRVPPLKPGSSALTQSQDYFKRYGREPFIRISDVDLEDNPYGNLTLTIAVGGGGYFGSFTINEILPSVELFQYYRPGLSPNTGVLTLQIKGRVGDINELMTRIYYNSENDRMGYCPFIVKASDNNNYGECSGMHLCGNNQPCDDNRLGEAHRESQAAEGKKQIDVIAGSKMRCQHIECGPCNAEKGCGWCPGSCNGVGKCMIGGASPLFEPCAPGVDGRRYKQCEVQPSALVGIAAGIAAGVFVLGFVVYKFDMFARRRHGGVVPYFMTKLLGARRFLRRIHVFPPDAANYLQFFSLALFVFLVFIVNLALQPSITTECVYHTSVFLDKSVKVNMLLDKCIVRFLPARKENWPDLRDYGVTSLKIKIAYSVMEGVTFEAETCLPDATISITNTLPIDIKYVGYYCNIAVLVPPNYIVPSTYIEDLNGFSTQVRGGSMDPDSKDFVIDFGPNYFQMRGAIINARLKGISARSFSYNADAGSLFIENLKTGLDGAEFLSKSADMIVTTPDRTSVRFWQRDGNKVCLTAAKNSLFVDGNCRRICAFLPAKAAPDTAPVFASPTTKEACESDTVAGEWDTVTDPPTCRLKCSSLQRPLIPGCYNMAACILLESPQCLCKPSCDLVPPTQLKYDGFSGVQGTCNDAGQCCRTICAGFSVADLHALPDMPRDGSMRSEDKYFMNQLDQRWTFQSETGQISFRVGSGAVGEEVQHSYAGGKPSDYIEMDVSISDGTKDTIDYLFHPGGDNAPKQELFSAGLSGPGTTAEADGQFLWLSKPLYLMIPTWLLEILSFGLLTPTKQRSNSALNPGFCPHAVPEGSPEFNKRMILIYKVLIDTFQNWPRGQLAKALPYGSMLVYKPVAASNNSLVFRTDPSTGEVLVMQFDPRQYSLLTLMLIFGLLIPTLIATVSCAIIIVGYRRHLFDWRRARLISNSVMERGITKQQEFTRLLERSQRLLQKARADLKDKPGDAKLQSKVEELRSQKFILEYRKQADKEEAQEVSEEAIRELTGTTNFFYMYQDFVSDPEMMRSIQVQIFEVAQEIVVAYFPTLLPLYVESLYSAALSADRCEFRPDRCTCLGERSVISVAVSALVFGHWIVSAAELGAYYLKLPYGKPRALIRLLFYISLSFFLWLSLTLMCLLCAWTFLGLNVNTLKAGPYVICGIGIILFTLFTFIKKTTFQARVQQALIKGVNARKGLLAKQFPDMVLDNILKSNITKALKASGLSFPTILISRCRGVSCLLHICI